MFDFVAHASLPVRSRPSGFKSSLELTLLTTHQCLSSYVSLTTDRITPRDSRNASLNLSSTCTPAGSRARRSQSLSLIQKRPSRPPFPFIHRFSDQPRQMLLMARLGRAGTGFRGRFITDKLPKSRRRLPPRWARQHDQTSRQNPMPDLHHMPRIHYLSRFRLAAIRSHPPGTARLGRQLTGFIRANHPKPFVQPRAALPTVRIRGSLTFHEDQMPQSIGHCNPSSIRFSASLRLGYRQLLRCSSIPCFPRSPSFSIASPVPTRPTSRS